MTTFIKTKLKKSIDEKTNIEKYRVAANITEYHIISILIFLSNIIPKFMKIRQFIHVDMFIKCQKSICLEWTYGLVKIIELLRLLQST